MASHEADRELQARVRQTDQRGQYTAGHGGEQGQQTGNREKKERRKETQRLKSITRSLLLMTQADAGRMPLALMRMNLSAALVELSEDVEMLAAEARLRVELNITAELWLNADWTLLRQAVLNLIHNGVRYNEPDSWIRLSLVARNGRVELEICNGGPGIPQADQPRLFDRFFRADAARDRGVDGVGLGLSLAREIVRAHGGTLLLKESRPGHTCFLMSLPGC